MKIGAAAVMSARYATKERAPVSTTLVVRRQNPTILHLRASNGKTQKFLGKNAGNKLVEHQFQTSGIRWTLRTHQTESGKASFRELIRSSERSGFLLSLWKGPKGKIMTKTANWWKNPSKALLAETRPLLSKDFTVTPNGEGAYVGDGVNFLPHSLPNTLYKWSADIVVIPSGQILLPAADAILNTVGDGLELELTPRFFTGSLEA